MRSSTKIHVYWGGSQLYNVMCSLFNSYYIMVTRLNWARGELAPRVLVWATIAISSLPLYLEYVSALLQILTTFRPYLTRECH